MNINSKKIHVIDYHNTLDIRMKFYHFVSTEKNDESDDDVPGCKVQVDAAEDGGPPTAHILCRNPISENRI